MPSVVALLSYLWNAYVDHLWNYHSNSWVATLAYAFRLWAILAILPTLVLALLVSIIFLSLTRRSPAADTDTYTQDVTSYVIARTLGDPTASTSHKSSFATQLPPKSKSDPKIVNANSTGPPTVLSDPDPDPDPDTIPVTVLSPREDESPSGFSSTERTTPASTTAAAPDIGSGATSSRAFFVDGEGSEDDGAARLAGVGVFSPVASMPGSPTVSRRNFFEKDGEDDSGGSGSSDESGSPFAAPRGVLLRSGGGGSGGTVIHHQHQHQHQHHQGGREAETEHEHEHSRSESDGGGGSTSGESSFAILDREESSFEDAGVHVHIRRRVPGASGASADE